MENLASEKNSFRFVTAPPACVCVVQLFHVRLLMAMVLISHGQGNTS